MKHIGTNIKSWVLSIHVPLAKLPFIHFITLTKRQQFVAVTILVSGILLLTQTVPQEFRYVFVVVLSLASYGLSALVLREDLAGIEWFTLLILPALYSAAFSLFYFLLPVRWLTRIPVLLLFGIGFYALLLTENIYNVAANRTIALLRAAHSIGFLLTFVTYYLLCQIVFSIRFSPLPNALVISLLSFPLIFQALWSMELTGKASGRVVALSVALTIVMMQVSWVLSFWPAPPLMNALFIASIFYSLVGMGQQYMVERMYKKTVIEFFSVSLFMVIVYIITTRWR